MLSLLVVMACHKPVFETVVTRVPPPDPEGAVCVESCVAVRDPCVKKAKALLHMCQSQAANMYAQCLTSRGAKPPPTQFGPFINTVGCLRTPCFNTEPPCITVYDACFSECGGVVTTEKRCVKNCGE